MSDRAAYVMWWVRSDWLPDDDWLWYTVVQSGTPTLPRLVSGAPGAQTPRLARGPGGSLHAAFRSYSAETDSYDTNYIQRMPDDPFAWPPPAYGPPALFATESESDDANLTVVQEPHDGRVRAHVVWSEQVGARNLIFYGRVGDGWQQGRTAGGASHIGGPGCANTTTTSVNCYAGFSPSVAVVSGPSGSEVFVMWEGRDELSGRKAIYWGYTLIQGDGTPRAPWSSVRELSGGSVNKGNATCPELNAEAPAIAVSPLGTVHAVWLEQEPDCQYYVRTTRLIYSPETQDYYPDYGERVSPRPVAVEYQQNTDHPRLAFDAQARRYVVWKETYNAIRAARASASAMDWADLGALNSGDCAGPAGVGGVDLVASPSRTMLHAVWAARSSATVSSVCYSGLDTLTSRAYLPHVQQAALPAVGSGGKQK